jgi:hypothetical protein
MDLRSEFEKAWRAGEPYDALLAIAHAHIVGGTPVLDAYQRLHELWQECGYDSADESCPLQDNVEYVMEKLWYEQPIAK